MNLLRGEVVLIEMPFHEGQGSKLRPAVVVLDSGDEDFVGAPLTSRLRVGRHELAITKWQAAGLNVASMMRVHKIAVLPKTVIRRRLGTLDNDDMNALQLELCRAFCQPST